MAITRPTQSNFSISYSTRAAAEAAQIPSVNMYIMVNGLMYKRDATGTALTTLGGDKWSPHGTIFVEHFGENTVPGTTPMQAIIEAAVLYADSLVIDRDERTINSGNSANTQAREIARAVTVTSFGAPLAVTAETEFLGVDGVRIVGCNFEAPSNSIWASGDFMFKFIEDPAVVSVNSVDNSGRVTFESCNFEGNHVCTSFVLFDNTADKCGVMECTGHGMTEYGIRATTKNSDFILRDNRFCQFTWDEVHDDTTFLVLPDSGDTARTAVIYSVESTDFRVYSNTCHYARIGFNVGSATTVGALAREEGAWDTGQFYGNHPFDCTEYVAYFNLSTASITNNYFDNGVVRIAAHQNGGITFSNNFFLKTGEVVYTHPLELEATTYNTTGSNLVLINNTFRYLENSLGTAEINFTTAATKSWISEYARQYIAFGNTYSNYNYNSGTPIFTRGAARGIDMARLGDYNGMTTEGYYVGNSGVVTGRFRSTSNDGVALTPVVSNVDLTSDQLYYDTDNDAWRFGLNDASGNDKGFILRSVGGINYLVQVDNAGNLTTTAL